MVSARKPGTMGDLDGGETGPGEFELGSGRSPGKSGFRPQTSIATFCSTMDMPMAVIRGEPRRVTQGRCGDALQPQPRAMHRHRRSTPAPRPGRRAAPV